MIVFVSFFPFPSASLPNHCKQQALFFDHVVESLIAARGALHILLILSLYSFGVIY